jgi:endo-1,4-beta-xylanase
VTPATATKSWQVRLPWASTISTPWNGVGSVRKDVLTVKNASWNGTVAAGRSVSFGFNDNHAKAMPSPTKCTALLNGAKTSCTVMVVGTR